MRNISEREPKSCRNDLLALAPAMRLGVDADDWLAAASEAWLDAFGYRLDEILGRPFLDFVCGEQRAQVAEALARWRREGPCKSLRCRMVRRDGGLVDTLTSAALASDGLSFGLVVTEVTALAQSESRYRELVEEQTDLVALHSVDGVIRYANRAYGAFCGLPPEEIVGRSLFDFVPEEEREALAAHLRCVLDSQVCLESENHNVSPGGVRRSLAWSNRALRDENGVVTGIHSVGRDIQARVDAERRLQESEARYRFLAENSTDLILLVGDGMRRLYASPASRKLLGYEPDELLALSLRESIHPEDAPRVLSLLADDPGDTTLTYRMRRKDGGYVWVETTGRTVEGGMGRRIVIVRDVERRVAAEGRLRASEGRYRLLADNSLDMVFQLDGEGVTRYASPSYREVLGVPAESMIGADPLELAHPEDAPRLSLALAALKRGETETLTIIYRLRHRDGRWIWTEARLRSLDDPVTGAPAGVIGAARDVSARVAVEGELAEANRRLRTLAGQDALTQLANRRSFDEALERSHRARQTEGRLSLVMVDVDRFKAFNDRYGHPAGDECLKRVAEAIAKSVRRPDDLAARYGGEEFAVVLPGADEAGALAVAQRIRRMVQRLRIPHQDSATGFLTVSIGVAAAGAASEPAEALLREADRALYLAKHGGRNAIVGASSEGAGASITTQAVSSLAS